MTDERGDIHIGSVSGQGFAIGHGSTGSYRGGLDPEILDQVERHLAELNALIDQHADHIADPDTARSAVAAVEQQLRAPQPQPSQVTMLLSAITGAASGVSAITAAVTGVRVLLGPLL